MLSIILPISTDCPTRRANLLTTLAFIKRQTFKDVEVILVEQDGEYYRDVDVDIYQAVRNPINNHFHRNWLLNIGANLAHGDKFLFMDTDLVFGNNYLGDVYEFKKPWFIAWDKLYYLNEIQTRSVREKKSITEPTGNAVTPGLQGACGASVCIWKDFYIDEFGGFSENYTFGWGGDDNDSAMRIKQILFDIPIMKHSIMHLNHDRSHTSTSRENSDQWWIVQHHPVEVNKRILATKLGRVEGPTLIDVSDLV